MLWVQLFKVAPCWLIRDSTATLWISFCQTAHDLKVWAGKNILGDQDRENMDAVFQFPKMNVSSFITLPCRIISFHKSVTDYEIDHHSLDNYIFLTSRLSVLLFVGGWVCHTLKFRVEPQNAPNKSSIVWCKTDHLT